MTHILEFLTLISEILMEFLNPGFSMEQPQLLALGGELGSG